MKIAIIIVSYNMAAGLKDCIGALLAQSVSGFRLIVIDDASSDGTENIVKGIPDSRIHYGRNDKRLGIAASRNRALSELKDEGLVFFTDADCLPESNWLEEGLKSFSADPSAIAVEGVTAYGGNDYRPRLSEKFWHRDARAGTCQTDNCAYKRAVFQKIGAFDEENFNYLAEDTDFFYRAKKAFPEGRFLICPDMKVAHRPSFWTVSRFFRDSCKARVFIRLIKKHGRLDFGRGKLGSFIISPGNFILAICPLAILIFVWKRRVRLCNFYDVFFLFLYVIKAYYYRFLIWYYAFRERVFVI